MGTKNENLGTNWSQDFFSESRALYLQKTVMTDVPNVHDMDFLVLYRMVFGYKSRGPEFQMTDAL